MTDRVPGAPGQYKAVITAEEQQKLAQAQPFTITLARDDHPIKEGTPYNKASVLPDTLAQTLCPGVEDPTPANALQALADRAIESQANFECRYHGTFSGEEEWINPPLVEGEFYRTEKRFCGKPVYEIYVKLGKMPSGTKEKPAYQHVNLGINANSVVGWKALVLEKVPLPGDDGAYRDRVSTFPYAEYGSLDVTGNLYFYDEGVMLASTSAMENVTEVIAVIQHIKGAIG